MAHIKCFTNVADDINSGEYISRKKAKTIYKNGVDLARQPISGIYYKKSKTGQQKGKYTSDVYISNNSNSKGCLIGAKNYDTLLSVTKGKYLSNPLNFDLRETQSLWTGSVYEMDMSGTAVIAKTHQWPDISYNTFNYPPSPSSNQTYPDSSLNMNTGPVIDMSYNIFYPSNITQSNNNICYLKNERAWKQYLVCLPYNESQALNYYNAHNGYIGDFNYPSKFSFDCSQKWLNTIQNCLNVPNGDNM